MIIFPFAGVETIHEWAYGEQEKRIKYSITHYLLAIIACSLISRWASFRKEVESQVSLHALFK